MVSTHRGNKPDDTAVAEQAICTRCGLCCNGTLFDKARLTKEDLGPSRGHRFHVTTTETHSHFTLPCHYQIDKKCSVYSGWRPRVCSEYVCKTIKRFRKGKISFDEALSVIVATLHHLDRLLKLFPESLTHKAHGYRRQSSLYISSHPDPEPLILLECAAFERRLQLHFFQKSNKPDAHSPDK